MSPPIGIKYYTLRNAGIAIVIYPQFRKSKNTGDVLWDGRDHSGYSLGINSVFTLDLKDTNISSTIKEGFYLSENTHWGSDMWDSSQEFYYDPNSNIVASATRWGGVHDGSLSYQGIRSKELNARMADSHSFARFELPFAEQCESYAASVGHETIRQLFDAAFAAEITAGFPWKGLVKWGSQLPPSQLLIAISLITAALVARGYTFSFTTTTNPDGTKTTTITFGPRQLPGAPGGVPPKIQADWSASVAVARQFNPKDLGVFANTGKLSNVDDVPNDDDVSNVDNVNSEAISSGVQTA